MKKVRVGVIGVGYLGQFHAEKYARMNDVELVGVVDIDKNRAETIAERVNTKSYTDHKALFGKVDAVSIAAPTSVHFDIAKDFLKKNIDVLIEKPITETTEEADELIHLAESRALLIQVGHLERFNPAVVALKDIVKKPMFIESHRLSIFQGRSTDVSVVLDLMIHDIDLILNFVKSKISAVYASGVPVVSEHVDIANARLEFESGCVANVTASRISTKNERKIRLFQRDAYVSVDFSKKEITAIQQTGSDDSGLIPGMEIKQVGFETGDALENELKSFVNAVIHREVPEVTAQMGRDALEIALDIMGQIKKGVQRFLS
ncbi:MAG: Gfo/Idh/MocA family oxidoreductase [Deltaproteobacteria bacterium]|jgi:predicted dehydrogenase|nr:Gfo/Idh/MocA family oxidoreductase [Deltaproteobacteria bacterium]